jgi:hypothetical protein
MPKAFCKELTCLEVLNSKAIDSKTINTESFDVGSPERLDFNDAIAAQELWVDEFKFLMNKYHDRRNIYDSLLNKNQKTDQVWSLVMIT